MPDDPNGPRTYQIEIRGSAAEEDLGSSSPLQVRAVRAEANSTLLVVWADQSGLIGLLRYLHSRGLVLLSVRSQEESEKGTEPGRHDG